MRSAWRRSPPIPAWGARRSAPIFHRSWKLSAGRKRPRISCVFGASMTRGRSATIHAYWNARRDPPPSGNVTPQWSSARPHRRRQIRRERRRDRHAIQARHAAQDGERIVEARCAEEHPADDDCNEGNQPRDRSPSDCRLLIRVLSEALAHCRPAVVDDEIHAVQTAPEDERPARAVPQPAEQHRDDQVQVASRRPLAVAAERDVEVVAQKARQRHVPAPPELDDVLRLVGRVEVERQLHAEHARQTDRHVGVAREVEVELERVGERAAPRGQQIRCAGVEKKRRRVRRPRRPRSPSS